ncbi:MAG: UPF0182 family protein, partial [Proteobacteria bacterium]|nr:UPF0182 family protein [Pseudomonadota bacterium]
MVLFWILTAVLPQAFQSLVVEPNELVKEAPFIVHNIAATRQGFGLDTVEERSLTGDASLDAEDIRENALSIKNVRLWDHEPLLVTFGQVQEIRPYYDFVAVDNDRYIIDGELRQTMLSPRELFVSSVPQKTWVNETMTYTHGYGVALGPVNEVTPEGLPKLFIKDLPPQVTHPDDIRVDEAAIYYGEAPDTPVFVQTNTPEFDYPYGEKRVFTKYDGKGGISIGNFLVRTLVAIRLGTAQVILSSDITADSKVLLYRNVMQRVQRLAPFLHYDNDPYMVVDNGRLSWVIEGYTKTGRFPYGETIRGVGNYMRNSVKIVIDAKDGDVTFYRIDDQDPIIMAWSNTFPDVFRPIDEMPESLRAHLRYPQALFRLQAHIFTTYHMKETQVFYSSEDEWEIPAVGGVRMEPYFIIMKLPDEDTEEFLLMLPYTPLNKPNLAAWMVARSDGEHYGKIRVYSFPKDKMVY